MHLKGIRLKEIRLYDYVHNETERHNALTSLKDGMLFSVMNGLTGPFWGASAIKLGATDYMLALLSSLPAAVGLLSQVPSALIIDRYDNRLKPTLIWAAAHRIFYLLFAVVVLLPIEDIAKAWTFILMFSLMNFPATTVGIAWTALMGELFDPRLRARIFGDRNMICTLTTLLSTAAAGPLLDSMAWPANYAVLYTVSFAMVMGSLYYLTKHKETPLAEDQRISSERGGKGFILVRNDKAFLKFVGAVLTIHVGFHVPASLWTILFVRIMNLSNAWLGAFSMASGICSFLSYKSWGKWCGHHGNLKVLAATAAAHIPLPVIYTYWRSPYVFIGLSCLGGFFGAGFGLALFNALLDFSPATARPAYVASYNVALGVSGVVWPFFGVWLYESFGMNFAMNTSFALRVLGIALTFTLIGKSSLDATEGAS